MCYKNKKYVVLNSDRNEPKHNTNLNEKWAGKIQTETVETGQLTSSDE